MTKTKSPAEKYIVAGGSHSRIENGERKKYECGDLIELSEMEFDRFPGRFMTLSDYESMVVADNRRRADEKRRQKSLLPPRRQKQADRDAEALKRQKNLLKLTRKSDRRTLMS